MLRPIATAALAASLLALPAAARADSDPPSDTLIGTDIYFPYAPRVGVGPAKTLTQTVARAKSAGYPIRVAVVSSPSDLGGVPDLFGQPQRYAQFLQQEITFNKKRPLLVVMPAGYGWVDAGPRAAQVMSSDFRPPGPLADTMAGGAAAAVARLATADGHRVDAPAGLPRSAGGGGGGGGGGSTPWWVFALPLVLVAAGVAALSLRARGRDEPGDPPPEATPPA
jgi:hypothetical protein